MKPSAPDHTLTLAASTDKWCPKYFYVTRLQNGYIVKTGIDREIFCETLEGVERALMDFSLCGTPKRKESEMKIEECANKWLEGKCFQSKCEQIGPYRCDHAMIFAEGIRTGLRAGKVAGMAVVDKYEFGRDIDRILAGDQDLPGEWE